MRFLNMNMETQCTPSRSSLMTGRWAIRSGTHSVPFGGVADGLTQWEVTIGEALSDAGYATGYYGKWHLGSFDGRLPNDQGFDEWYGIPRTTDEARWPSSPGWSPNIMPAEHTMEGKKGEKSRELKVYDVVERRLIDAEITRRSVAYIAQHANGDKPFFAYVALTQPHLPTEPNPAFAGKTGNGEWADMLAEMDANVGQILDAVDKAGVRDSTVVIFTSDNGAEFLKPWDGWAGPWRGQYFTALEGGIRVPFLIRWPGKIAAERVSNEIVHGVDMFATLAKIGPRGVPDLLRRAVAGREMAQLETAFHAAGHDVRPAGEEPGADDLQPLPGPARGDADSGYMGGWSDSEDRGCLRSEREAVSAHPHGHA